MKPLSWGEYVRLALSYSEFSRNEDGSWTVTTPVLAGCITWGETRAEAALMAEDAIQGWLVTALRFGDEVPLIDGYGLAYLDDSGAGSAVSYAQTHS